MKLKEITYLKEGGFAASEWNVGRINKGDIPATIKYVSKISGIPVKELHPLGSVGKKSTSGDIDLAVDINKYDMNDIHTKMMEELNDEGVMNKGTKIGSYAVPIQGHKGKVQVDLMYVNNVKWAQFAYFSSPDSQYKGAIRTILLMAVAASLNEPGTDHFEFSEDGELIIRAGRTLDLATGLRRIFQHRPTKKKGGGYVKTMKSIPVDEFQKMFPEVEVQGDNVLIDDPEMVVQMLFGPGIKPADVDTAEEVLALIQAKFKDPDKILHFAKSRIKALGNKMKIPEALK
jgi:hypothetical protein